MAKKPLWMQIAEKAAKDPETLKLMKDFAEAKGDKKFEELGQSVYGILDEMSMEFEGHFPERDWLGQLLEEQIREKMDNHFFAECDRLLGYSQGTLKERTSK